LTNAKAIEEIPKLLLKIFTLMMETTRFVETLETPTFEED
jgi:hypothetical protein